MGIADRLARLVARPTVTLARADIARLVHDALAGRTFASPQEVDAIGREVAILRATSDRVGAERIVALEADVVALKKRLSMAMGALQAATAQLQEARRCADDALAIASRASQLATAATTTAESAADGARALATAPPPTAPVVRVEPDTCSVPGCLEQRRAKGMCARHYQQWKRGRIEAPDPTG